MECPNCKKELVLPRKAYLNVETYSPHIAMVASECCGVGFVIKCEVSFKITQYSGEKENDDWGKKLSKIAVKPTN